MPDDTTPTAPDRDEPPADPTPEELERVAVPGAVRRAPRYRAFVLAGALVGLLVAAVVVLVGPAGGELGRGPVLVFVGLTLALVGGLGGALVAALLDRATRRGD